MTPYLEEARARLDKARPALLRLEVPGLPPGYLGEYLGRNEDLVLELLRQKLLQRAGRGPAAEPPCTTPVRVYIAQTRSPVLLERLARWGWGEITQRGELPPQRYPWVYDCAAFKDWQSGKAFDAVQYDRDIWWITNHVEAGDVPPPDWIVLPDLPARGAESLALSRSYLDGPNAPPRGYPAPVYLVVQDGMTEEDIVPLLPQLGGIFIGGSQKWKNDNIGRWARFAQLNGKGFHVGRGANKETLGLARLHGATSLDSALPLFSEGNLQSFRRDFCHPDILTTTPGTRIRWRTLRDWLKGWSTINRRRISAAVYAARSAHLSALGTRLDLLEISEDAESLRGAVRVLEERNLATHPDQERLLVRAKNRLGQLGHTNRKSELRAAPAPLPAPVLSPRRRLAELGLAVRQRGRRGMVWDVWGEIERHEALLKAKGGMETESGYTFTYDPTMALLVALEHEDLDLVEVRAAERRRKDAEGEARAHKHLWETARRRGADEERAEAEYRAALRLLEEARAEERAALEAMVAGRGPADSKE